ncbi:MAG: sigma-70 family RNA polymerase sigma factor [Paracoccaceae bacterium]
MTADPISGLIAATANADRGAFRELYSATSSKLFGVCLRILKDRSEAEDAMQEVYTRVWLNARRYDSAKARGMTWLIAVARNLSIDRLRARPAAPLNPGKRAKAETGPAADPVAEVADTRRGPEDEVIARSEAQRVVDCFGTLEPERAAALRGAYLDGSSYEELSLHHDVPLNTMRSWLRRGLQKLKECLEA